MSDYDKRFNVSYCFVSYYTNDPRKALELFDLPTVNGRTDYGKDMDW